MRKKALPFVLLLFTFLLTFILIISSVAPLTISPSIADINSDSRLQVQVNSYGYAASIPHYPYNPDITGYVWAWVDISITNIGSTSISINSLYAYLKDNQNYLYESEVTLAPLSLKLQDLPPSQMTRGEVYFEVPPEAQITSFLWADLYSYILVPKSTSTPQILPPTGSSSSIIGVNSDNRIQIQVYDFKSTPTIAYYPYSTDTTGYVWAWVDLAITNVGLTKVSTNSLYAHLKDGQNYLYESDIALSPIRLQLLELPPNETIRGEIYFQILSTAKIVTFSWNDYYSNIVIPPVVTPTPTPAPTPTPVPTLTPKPTPEPPPSPAPSPTPIQTPDRTIFPTATPTTSPTQPPSLTSPPTVPPTSLPTATPIFPELLLIAMIPALALIIAGIILIRKKKFAHNKQLL